MTPIPYKSKVIGVVGTRRRDAPKDYDACSKAFFKIFKRGDRIVSGGCPTGGDRFAEILAKLYQCTITIHYAHWLGPAGKKAGFIRNTDIAQDCDVLIAVVAPDRKGGAEDTIKKTKALGKEIILC